MAGYVYYICNNNNDIIYIGSTTNPDIRFSEHSRRAEFKGKSIYYFKDVNFRDTEKKLIKQHLPIYNKARNFLSPKQRKLLAESIQRKDCQEARKKILQIMSDHKASFNDISEITGLSSYYFHNILSSSHKLNPKTAQKLHSALIQIENKFLP